VTATRDRDSDLDSDKTDVEWDERPVIGRGRGLPWWAAVLLALVLAAAGAVFDRARLVDDQRLNSLGPYLVLFLVGCVAAVLAVRRRNLFGPMVQPPLIFAVTFVAVQLTARESTGTETGTKKLIFEVGLPLASSFPWMAGATAATVVLGIVRLLTQRDPNRAARSDGEDNERPARPEAATRKSRDRDDRPPKGDRPARDERARERDSRGRGQEEQRPRDDRAQRRDASPPARRPSRDREDRPERGDRRDRGSDRGSRSEAPPRRNPQRPREQRGPQPRRRPREDDYTD
jgi:hypothetical protein